MRSNRMQRTLDALKFRVSAPEAGIPEDHAGAVITALNEEAVAAAARASKGGINIIVTYEAFGMKMHGVVRQQIIFTDQAHEAGRPVGWLSVPLVLTSHTWENAKNERSHQDPSLAEVLLGEPADVARVLFPADYNTAAVVMREVYRTRGQIWALVVPKGDVPVLFTPEEAERLLQDGGLVLGWAGHAGDRPRVVLATLGAYQLGQVLRASRRLAERGVGHAVVYLIEPGRFRAPRSPREASHMASAEVGQRLFPEGTPVVFVAHTRPETLLGCSTPSVTGAGPRASGTSTTAGR